MTKLTDIYIIKEAFDEFKTKKLKAKVEHILIEVFANFAPHLLSYLESIDKKFFLNPVTKKESTRYRKLVAIINDVKAKKTSMKNGELHGSWRDLYSQLNIEPEDVTYNTQNMYEFFRTKVDGYNDIFIFLEDLKVRITNDDNKEEIRIFIEEQEYDVEDHEVKPIDDIVNKFNEISKDVVEKMTVTT